MRDWARWPEAARFLVVRTVAEAEAEEEGSPPPEEEVEEAEEGALEKEAFFPLSLTLKWNWESPMTPEFESGKAR